MTRPLALLLASVLFLFDRYGFLLGSPAPLLLAFALLGLPAMGLLFGLFSLGFEPRLAGIGGDLGATAAVSVFALLGAPVLLSRLRPGLSP